MASIAILKDKNGKIRGYKARACLGRDDNNRQVWKSKTFEPLGMTPGKELEKISRIAGEWEEREKAAYKAGIPTEDKTQFTFADFVEKRFLPDFVEDGKHKPATIAYYGFMSKDLVEYFGRKVKLNQIDAERVRRFVKYLRTEAKGKDGQPLKPSSQRHLYTALRTILEHARRNKYIQENPCGDLLTTEKPTVTGHRDIDFLAPEDAKRFVKALEEEPLFWRAYMTLLLLSGLRRGEALSLQWRDLDTDKREIHIERNITVNTHSDTGYSIGTPKSGHARIVPLPRTAYSLIQKLRAEREQQYGAQMPDDSYIFCRNGKPETPTYPSAPTKWLSRFIKRHNLPDCSPHDLRHSFASLSLEKGSNIKQIQEVLGHADISTTLAFYSGVTPERKREAVDSVDKLLF